MRIFLIFLCIIFIVAGCWANLARSESTVQTTPTFIQNPDIPIITIDPNLVFAPSPTGYPGAVSSTDPVPNAILDLVMKDLVEKSGTEPEKIHILETEAVDWPDSSLGCGQPGEVYMPVITPGFRILLKVDGQVYSYHTNTTSYFILCEMPTPIINSTPSRSRQYEFMRIIPPPLEVGAENL